MNQSRIKVERINFRFLNTCKLNNSANKYWIIDSGIDSDSIYGLVDSGNNAATEYSIIDNGIDPDAIYRYNIKIGNIALSKLRLFYRC